MKVAYVAGPYRSKEGPNGIHRNIQEARAVAIALWNMGYAVICPHLNTAFFDGAAPDSVWLTGDLAIQERCDLTVLTPRWAESTGARGEKEHAEKIGQPVYYWPEVPTAWEQ